MSRFNSSRSKRFLAAALSGTVLLGLGVLPPHALAAPLAPPPQSPSIPAPGPSIEPPPSEPIVPLAETSSPEIPAAEPWSPSAATPSMATTNTTVAVPGVLDLSAPPPPAAPATPIYEKWWFWTAIAAVAVTTVVIVVVTSGPTPPKTDLGNMVAF